MSEPNVEAVIAAAAKRSRKPADQAVSNPTPAAPAVQPVTLTAKAPVEVAADDPQLANLMRAGLSEDEARKLVSDLRRMW